MVDVPVNKDVLVWARNERGLSSEEAAKRLKLTLQELTEYETGKKSPKLSLLDRIARQYRIPFAALMMPEPLSAVKRPTDFRTYEGKVPIWDENLLIAIETASAKIDLLAELRAHDPELFAAPPIRSYSIDQDAAAVAKEERNLFDVRLDEQFGWPSGAQGFRHWRNRVERAGIFVQIMDLGPENLCRGFAIYDHREIPSVVINGDDSDGPARTFTLLHEYAHLLIREPGVSDQNRSNKIEQWCNKFTAYFLMPADRFKIDAVEIDKTRNWSDAAVRKIADLYNVSMSAVALHLENVGLAPSGLYEKKLADWRKRKRKKPSGGQPMTYPERQVHRLGVRHVSVVLDAVDRRDINSIEAFELTDIDSKHFNDLRKEIAERQRSYGGVR